MTEPVGKFPSGEPPMEAGLGGQEGGVAVAKFVRVVDAGVLSWDEGAELCPAAVSARQESRRTRHSGPSLGTRKRFMANAFQWALNACQKCRLGLSLPQIVRPTLHVEHSWNLSLPEGD